MARADFSSPAVDGPVAGGGRAGRSTRLTATNPAASAGVPLACQRPSQSLSTSEESDVQDPITHAEATLPTISPTLLMTSAARGSCKNLRWKMKAAGMAAQAAPCARRRGQRISRKDGTSRGAIRKGKKKDSYVRRQSEAGVSAARQVHG